jgi:hypothetical protein
MGWLVNATLRPLYPMRLPGNHHVVVWIGLRAGMVGCGIFRSPPGFDPRTVHPVVSRYAD